jgi:hypothetical protein
MHRAIMGLLVAAGTAGQARAQVVPTPAQCSSAAQAVSGRALPAVTDSVFIRWYVLAGCGTTGETAAAAALGTVAVLSETDSSRAIEFFQLFYARRSLALFYALQAAVGSSGASSVVALQAIRAFGGLHLPGYEFDSSAFSQPSATYCGFNRRVIAPVGALGDLPPDYLSRMVGTMSDVESNLSRPSIVRGAAHCWRVTLERDLPPDAKMIKLKHLCKQKFRVENANPARVTLTIDVEGTTEKHAFPVAGRASFDFEVLHTGHVRLFLNGRQIDKKETTSNRCT